MAFTNRLSEDEWCNRHLELQNKIEKICRGNQEGIVMSVFTKIINDILEQKDMEKRKIIVDDINFLFNEVLKTND